MPQHVGPADSTSQCGPFNLISLSSMRDIERTPRCLASSGHFVMESFPCTALLTTPPEEPRQRYGGPLMISFTEAQVPRPPRSILQESSVDSKNYLCVSGRTYMGIFHQPYGSGTNPYLVFSWDLNHPSLPEHKHHALLMEAEHGCSDKCMRWIMDASGAARWRPNGDLDYVRTRMPKRLMRELFNEYGDPEDEGRWLAARLLPRRRPAAITLSSSTHLILYVALFTPQPTRPVRVPKRSNDVLGLT